MKATNVYDNDQYVFPLYCNEWESWEPCFLVDTRNGEVWCATRPKNSQSEAEWHGYVNRICINGNFVDDDDVDEFINDNLELVQKYLDGKISYELFENVIIENSYRWNDEKIICESFSDYRQFCNLDAIDINKELDTFNYDVSEYAEDLVSSEGFTSVYFKGCPSEALEEEIVEYLNEDYEAVFKDEGGWHKSLRLIAEQNEDALLEADEQKVADIFFKNDRSIDTTEIYNQLQLVKADKLDWEDFVEGLEL